MKPTPEQLITRLTDPLAVAPWMLEPETDDHIRDGYAPRGSDLRDFTIIRHDGAWHVIYTDFRLNQHSRTPGQGVFLSHASSTKLTDWTATGPCLHIEPGEWDGRALWAPYALRKDDLFYVFYTGLSDTLSQSIGLATSTDLTKLIRHHANPVLTPGACDWCVWSRDRLANCRDPHVMPLGDRFYLYYTALCKTGEVCVAAAESTDLLRWRDLGPVIRIYPERLDISPLCLESACVHPCAGGYLLSYSYDRAIWLNFSTDPLHFDPARSVRALEGHLGLEKVLEVNDHTWLVAFFNQIAKGRPSRLFFGTLDFSVAEPAVRILSSRDEMDRILKEQP